MATGLQVRLTAGRRERVGSELWIGPALRLLQIRQLVVIQETNGDPQRFMKTVEPGRGAAGPVVLTGPAGPAGHHVHQDFYFCFLTSSTLVSFSEQ